LIGVSDAYDELYVYTMSRGRDRFILQHVVDAQAAQTATEQTKPLGLTFSLVGLYLHVERGFSGRRVQEVHMELARTKRPWPSIALPADRGSLTPADVLAVPPGADRDAAIDGWCASVWATYQAARPQIIELLRAARIAGA
jgi:hypothetical protein